MSENEPGGSAVRVRVAGWGWVSPLGRDPERVFGRLLQGACAIGPLRRFELPLARVTLAAEARLEEPAPAGWSHADAMAVAAARDALAMAGVVDCRDVSLWVGGTASGMQEAETTLAALTADPGREDFDRSVIPGHVLSAPAARIAEVCGPFAERSTLCSACSGGAAAIALAAASIATGRVRRALAGGVDALCRMNHAGFNALSALDANPCRPFHADRGGLSLGEGAAFLLLEAADPDGDPEAVSLAGWALASEAHHITQPAPDGAVAAATIERALARGGIERVDWVNAHGTATPHNDPAEAAALRRAFGDRVPPVSSLKGAWGHALAASGALEAVASVLAIEAGAIPPTSRLDRPAEELADLDLVVEARRGPVEAVVSDAFGFGGTDVVLAFARGGEVTPRAERPLVVTGAAILGPGGLRTGADVATPFLAPGSPPPDAPVELPGGLDPMRVRRFDRASKLATTVAQAVHRGDGAATGIVVGSAFGSVAATGAFLRRVVERGARYAPPAQFPSVLPSALASHPSIYLGLGGPALSCSDGATSGEAAAAVAQLLLADGQAEAMVAVAAEEHSEVASRVSTPIVNGLPTEHRAEGAAALLLETRAHAEARGARPWASLAFFARGLRPSEPPEPPAGAVVVVARAGLEVPAGWREAPLLHAPQLGDHESVGGAALAGAVALVGFGHAPAALVLGGFGERRYLWMWTACEPSESK